LQCSLLACERLDAACLLQISNLWNKRKKYAENDFYAEDEDIFYDRTGQLEEQREKRKRWYEVWFNLFLKYFLQFKGRRWIN